MFLFVYFRFASIFPCLCFKKDQEHRLSACFFFFFFAGRSRGVQVPRRGAWGFHELRDFGLGMARNFSCDENVGMPSMNLLLTAFNP